MKRNVINITQGFFYRLLAYGGMLSLFYFEFDITLLVCASLLYGIYLLDILYSNIGKTIPIIELTLALYGFQLLITPCLDYLIFDYSFPTGEMKVDEKTYLSYALPAVMLLHLGIHMFGKLRLTSRIENQIIQKILVNRRENIRIGSTLIIIGLIATPLVELPLPSALGFIVKTFVSLKFIGYFYLFFCQSRYAFTAFLLVFVTFAYVAIVDTVLIDLIIWTFFLLSTFLRGKRVPIFLISLGSLVALGILFVIQSVKIEYRLISWSENKEEAGLATFVRLVENKYRDITYEELKLTGGFVNVRFNQGWIITDVQKHLEESPEDFAQGSWFFKEVVGVFLPRFIYPNKPVVADREKFSQFSGKFLVNNTTMSVGALGDGYGNFGYWGGLIFCFGFGCFIGWLKSKVYALSLRKYPALLCWTPVIFFYVMRAGNDFYMISNYMVKVLIFAIIFFYLLKYVRKES